MRLGVALLSCLLLSACSAPQPEAATVPTPGAMPQGPSMSPTMLTATPTPSFTADELALLKADGWSLNDPAAKGFVDSAHNFCSSLTSIKDEDIFTALKASTEAKRLTGGRIMLLLCKEPRFTPLVVAVEVPGSFASGTYYVGTAPGELKPGQYKTTGAVQNCYWVRKDKAGKILANDLVTNAPGGVRITVKPSDYEVTMERCGIWVLVK